MAKIGVDNQVSKDIIKNLIKKGFEIVHSAGDEPDDVWVDKALMKGATIIISPDVDIPILLDRLDASDVLWIDIPRGYKQKKLENYLVGKLLDCIK